MNLSPAMLPGVDRDVPRMLKLAWMKACVALDFRMFSDFSFEFMPFSRKIKEVGV